MPPRTGGRRHGRHDRSTCGSRLAGSPVRRPAEPARAPGQRSRARGCLGVGHCQVRMGVARKRARRVASPCGLLDRDLPDRLEHLEALSAIAVGGHHQALVDEARHGAREGRPQARRPARIRPPAPAAGSPRRTQPSGQTAPDSARPGGRGSTRRLPAASAGGSGCRGARHPAGRSGRRDDRGPRKRPEQADPGRRQLDPQWKPIETSTDVGDRLGVGGRELECRSHSPCPLDEQLDRRDQRKRDRVVFLHRAWDGQWSHRIRLLRGETKGAPGSWPRP